MIILLFIFISYTAYASELVNLLNKDYNKLYELKFLQNSSDKNFNTLSWISPINLSYDKSWSNQLTQKYVVNKTFRISYEQAIFKSGGIYFGIKYAKAKANKNFILIYKEKKGLIINAIELLINYKISELNIAKIKTQLKINEIEIKNSKELFNAGMLDAISLDNALIKKEQNSINLLNLKNNLASIKESFEKISSKNIENLKIPKLKLLSKREFLDKNLDLALAKADSRSSKYLYKLTTTKYLPTISVGVNHTNILNKDINTKRVFNNYHLQISMPISINVKNDIQRAKIDYLIKKINIKNKYKSASIFYDTILKKISLYDKQISLTNKEILIYRNLLKHTKNLYKVGEKKYSDIDILRLTLKIKKIDKDIFTLNKKLEILKLYKVIK